MSGGSLTTTTTSSSMNLVSHHVAFVGEGESSSVIATASADVPHTGDDEGDSCSVVH